MTTILDIESIEWIAVTEALPDDDTTVLIHAPNADDPAWLGYYTVDGWFAVGGECYGDDEEIAAEVTAWATMPAGPGV